MSAQEKGTDAAESDKETKEGQSKKSEMAVKLIKSERNSRITRVTAYVRVSTTMEEQQGSYENQIRYYETFFY